MSFDAGAGEWACGSTRESRKMTYTFPCKQMERFQRPRCLQHNLKLSGGQIAGSELQRYDLRGCWLQTVQIALGCPHSFGVRAMECDNADRGQQQERSNACTLTVIVLVFEVYVLSLAQA